MRARLFLSRRARGSARSLSRPRPRGLRAPPSRRDGALPDDRGALARVSRARRGGRRAAWFRGARGRGLSALRPPGSGLRARRVRPVRLGAARRFPLQTARILPILPWPAHGGYVAPPRGESLPRGPRETVGVLAPVEAAGPLRLRPGAVRRGARRVHRGAHPLSEAPREAGARPALAEAGADGSGERDPARRLLLEAQCPLPRARARWRLRAPRSERAARVPRPERAQRRGGGGGRQEDRAPGPEDPRAPRPHSRGDRRARRPRRAGGRAARPVRVLRRGGLGPRPRRRQGGAAAAQGRGAESCAGGAAVRGGPGRQRARPGRDFGRATARGSSGCAGTCAARRSRRTGSSSTRAASSVTR